MHRISLPGFAPKATLAFVLPALALTGFAAPALADDAEIHTFHCLYGCPMGAAETNDLIVREIYTLSSNDLTKFADWVAYRVSPQTVGPSGARAWKKDPWLADDETLAPPDYDGASSALDIDRGHQAPLAALSGTPTAADTNILSNITPQKKGLNQSSWQFLEGAERKLALVPGGKPVYVITGPLYESEMPSLPRTRKAHRLPSGYWKVIATEDGRVSSFIFEQTTPRGANYCTFRKPLAEVETRAKLKLFPRLARRNFTSLDAALGCP